MNTYIKHLRAAALAVSFTAVALTGATLTGAAHAEPQASSVKLLTAKFDSRRVAQVEVGDFHFKPGQTAPIHTHSAPAVGYVAKGTIIYQVEGEAPRILRAGDAFFEPVGPRILRFDNASATEEAIFLDFNLEQAGEPFIVFEKELTEANDRRTLPTIDLGGKKIDQVDIYARDLKRGQTVKLETSQPTLGIVAEGIIELHVKGKTTQRLVAGKSFSLTAANAEATIVNASSEVSAKVITFRLR